MITMSVSGTSPEITKAIVKSISSPIRAESLPDLLHKVSSARPKDSTRSLARQITKQPTGDTAS